MLEDINIFSIHCTAIFLIIASIIGGQFTTDPGADKPTVAILDFEPEASVFMMCRLFQNA